MRAVSFTACWLAFAATAGATPVTYNFTGTVIRADAQRGDPPVGDGRRVAISVTLDASFADRDPSPDIGSYDGYADVGPVLAATFDGEDARGFYASVTVSRGVGGVDSFDVFSGSPLIYVGFTLEFSTARPGVLLGDAIPAALDPGRFETATFSRLSLYEGGFVEIAGTIDAAAPVPAPGSLLLLATGLALLAGAGYGRHRGGPAHAWAMPRTRRRAAGFTPQPAAGTSPAAGA